MIYDYFHCDGDREQIKLYIFLVDKKEIQVIIQEILFVLFGFGELFIRSCWCVGKFITVKLETGFGC